MSIVITGDVNTSWAAVENVQGEWTQTTRCPRASPLEGAMASMGMQAPSRTPSSPAEHWTFFRGDKRFDQFCANTGSNFEGVPADIK